LFLESAPIVPELRNNSEPPLVSLFAMNRTPHLITFLAVVFAAGCTTIPQLPRHGVPTSVLLNGDTGEFSLRVDEALEVSRQTLPGQVPVVTVYGSNQYHGLLIRPDTGAWRSIRVNAASQSTFEQIQFPVLIRTEGESWQLVHGTRLVHRAELQEAATTPIGAAVAVDTPASWYPPLLVRGLIKGEDRGWKE